MGRCQVLANLAATFEARAFFGGVSVRKSRGRLSFSDWQQMTRFKERLLQQCRQLCIQNLTEPQMNFTAHQGFLTLCNLLDMALSPCNAILFVRYGSKHNANCDG